jgi:electron transfer flavoprotein beta subunit
MPSLTQVIKIDVEDGALRCERQAEYGYDTVLVELPAVISVGDAINEPRYPSLKAIMGAKKKPLDLLAIGDAGIEADRVGFDNARAHCSDFSAPPAKEAGRIIEDEDTNETVEQIVAWLDERKLIS